jgi:acyl-CoA thioesterase-2
VSGIGCWRTHTAERGTVLIDESDTAYTDWWATAFTLVSESATRFRSKLSPPIFPTLYGGQLAAQLLLAAARTVDDDRTPHALHTTFVRMGMVDEDVAFDVETVRDTRAMSTRLVRATQGGRIIAMATASFHIEAAALSEHDIGHQSPIPPPENLRGRKQLLAERADAPDAALLGTRWPVDLRYIDQVPWSMSEGDGAEYPRNKMWLRTIGDLPAVPAASEAAIVLATDLPMYEPVLFPSRYTWDDTMTNDEIIIASLDHVLWFHRSVPPGTWLVMDQESPVASAGRGFCRAALRDAEGRLVSSVAQEIMLRERAY